MPPKTRFDKTNIIKTSYELMEEKGIEAVVAREIAKKLGSTTAPIFTCFKNMDELIEAVYNLATDKCEEYLNEAINYSPALKEFGLRLYRYSKSHPNAYKFIFMKHKSDSNQNFANVGFIDILEPLISEESEEFNISYEESRKLINMMCVYSLGLGTLCVNKIKEFSEDEVSNQISTQFISLLSTIKMANGSFDIKQMEMMLTHVNELPIKKK